MSNDGVKANRGRRLLQNTNVYLGEALNQQTAVNMLVNIASVRDRETGKHVRRVQEYVSVLAAALGRFQKFAGVVTESWIANLVRAVPLHDIGKIGVPDAILLKPGRLTAAEFAVMKTHCRIGHDIIAQAEGESKDGGFWAVAKEIALSHHERWDGSGYPRGLAAESIPLSARLVALADVFDASATFRVYQSPLPTKEVAEMLIRSSGIHFDPDIVDTFLAVRPEFERIAALFADSGPLLASVAGCGR